MWELASIELKQDKKTKTELVLSLIQTTKKLFSEIPASQTLPLIIKI